MFPSTTLICKEESTTAHTKISAAQNHNALPFPYAFAVKRHLFIVTYNPKSSEFDADMGKELPCHY